MHLSFRALRYAIAVSEFGNITQAARDLGISQPSLSAAIADLEHAVGAKLFIRHHARGVTLSAAGRRFIAECQVLMGHVRQFQDRVGQIGPETRGEVRVGCLGTLALRYLPRLLAEVSERLPALTVRLDEASQAGILDGLLQGRHEIAIGYDYGLPPEIAATRLKALPPCVLLPASHPLAAAPSVSLADLADAPYLLLDLPITRDYFLSLFKAAGITPAIAFRSTSFELIRGLVGQGRGYTIHNALPDTSATYDGRQVIARPIRETLAPVSVCALHLRGQSLRPPAQAFRSFVTGFFQPTGSTAPPAGI